MNRARLSRSTHVQRTSQNGAIGTVADSRSRVLLNHLDRVENGNAAGASAHPPSVEPPTRAPAYVKGPLELVAATIKAYNDHDLHRLAALHDPAARISFAGIEGDIGLDEWCASLEGLFTILPDFTVSPVTVVADKHAGIVEVNLTGTNSGEIALSEDDQRLLRVDDDCLRPTGRSVRVTGVVVLLTADGRVSHETHHWPRFWLYESLGLVTVECRPRRSPEPASPGPSRSTA